MEAGEEIPVGLPETVPKIVLSGRRRAEIGYDWRLPAHLASDAYLSRPPMRTATGPALLYFPEYDSRVTRSGRLELPTSILHVAAALLAEGHRVRIVDGRMAEAHDTLRDLVEPPLFVGLSSFFGQIADGIAAARLIRRRFGGNVPLIWGGWLPTVYPRPFLDHELCTALVRGPGEQPVQEIAARLTRGQDLAGIPGVVLPTGTPDVLGVEEFGRLQAPSLDLPLHLLDIDRYEVAEGRIDLVTSRGCPLRCTFCAMASHYRGRWCARDGSAIAAALADLARRFGLKRVQFYDDTFFADTKRVLTLARILVERGPPLRWMATGGVHELLALDDEGWDLAARSGCSIVSSGVESGSDRVRRRLGKRFASDDVRKLVRRLHRHGVRFAPFFILGSPGESREELDATFRLVEEILAVDPTNAPLLSLFLYFPMPDTPLFRSEEKKGELVAYPGSLEQLARIPPESQWGQAPWVPRSPFLSHYRNRDRWHALVRAFYFWATHLSPALSHRRSNVVLEALRAGLHAQMMFRFRRGWTGVPVAWHAYRIGWALRRLYRGTTASDLWSRGDVGLLPHNGGSVGNLSGSFAGAFSAARPPPRRRS